MGLFTMDPSIVVPEQTEKDQPQTIQGVQFQHVSVQKADSQLIDFIYQYTGKMRSLAESDLDSYLRLGIQLLNIGKPFYLEGIGTLIKNKEAGFEFEPGEYNMARLSLPGHEKTDTEKRKKGLNEPEKEYASQSRKAKSLLLVVAFIGGLLLIAWAGYHLYKNKTVPLDPHENNAVVLQQDTQAQPPADTLAHAPVKADSVTKKDSALSVTAIPDSGAYRFVILETADKGRALRRYEQLLSYKLKVKMETRDSSFFKIYFTIHAPPRDTLRIKDSLNDYYAAKTIIELNK